MAAIYQWFEGAEVTFTTTLYPITDINYVDVTCTFNDGEMRPIPPDFVELDTVQPISGTLQRYLYWTDPEDDDVELDYLRPLDGTLTSMLFSTPPEDDTVELDFLRPLNGTLDRILVTVDSPDEMLGISCAVYPSGCSMTLV